MSDPKMEDAKKAHLKQLFGGSLEPDERALVGTLEASPEGAAYARETRELKSLLAEVATVTPKPAHPKEMVRQFEMAVRESSRKGLRMGRWAAIGQSLVVGSALVVFCLKPSWETAGFVLLAGSMMAFAFLGIRLNRKHLGDPALFDTLLADKRSGLDPWVRLRSWGLTTLFTGVFCVWAYSGDGLLGTALYLVGFLLLLLASRAYAKLLRGNDLEAWSWWEKQA